MIKLYAVARDGLSILDSVIITGSGTYTMRNPGIIRVGLAEYPDDGNPNISMAWYSKASFEPDCAPANDPVRSPVVESAEVRAALVQALKQSNIDSSAHRRIERGGWIYQRPDSSYFVKRWDDPNATACDFTIPGAPVDPNGVPVGQFHTHPHNQGDPVFGYDPVNEPLGCHKYKPGEKAAAVPLKNGGGSDLDWGASVIGPPMYVITKAKSTMFYLDPIRFDRPTNPYKFRFNLADPGACAPRVS